MISKIKSLFCATFLVCSSFFVFQASGATVQFLNLNDVPDGYSAIFDSTGNTLLPASLSSNIRVGYFADEGVQLSDATIQNATSNNELLLFWTQFGNSQGMGAGFDFDGAFDFTVAETSDDFTGYNVYLWLVDTDDISSANETLIFKYDSTFQTEPWSPDAFVFGTGNPTPGTLLWGSQQGTFDAGFGSPEPAYRLEVIPEPSTYAALFGLAVLGLALVRRRISK
jgi:hypothetical protein